MQLVHYSINRLLRPFSGAIGISEIEKQLIPDGVLHLKHGFLGNFISDRSLADRSEFVFPFPDVIEAVGGWYIRPFRNLFNKLLKFTIDMIDKAPVVIW